jgi:hypothetical protein
LAIGSAPSNLPRLHRKRAESLDEERAQTVLRLVITACERAIKLNIADEWVRPTLLRAAFDLGPTIRLKNWQGP